MAKKKIQAARRPSTRAKAGDAKATAVAPSKTPKAVVLVKPKSQADSPWLIMRKSSV